MKIPNQSNPIFVQKNNGARDTSANIAGSFNIDLTRKPGKLMPSPRLKQVINTTDDAQMTSMNAFAFANSAYWAVGDYIWHTDSTDPTTSWAQDTTTDTPTLSTVYADMVVFNDQLLVSTSTNVAKLGVSSWDVDWYTTIVTGGSTLQSGIAHPMAVVQIGSPMLCIGDGNYMNTVVGTTATDPRLTLDASMRIRWIVGGNSRAYIGCTNVNNAIAESFVYEWDGGDTVPTRAYKLNARGAMSGVIYDETLYVVASDGGIYALAGSGFELVAQFPVFNSRWQPRGYDAYNLSLGLVSHKGMCVSKGKILININGGVTNGNTIDDEIPEYTASGVWEFDPKTNSLSHKYGVTMDKTGVTDFGQRLVPANGDEYTGAVFEARHQSASILVSGGYNTTATGTPKTGIYVDDVDGGLTRRARFITTQSFAPDLANDWTINIKYSPMKSSDDRIVIKYRLNESGTLPFTGAVTWTDSDTFTSTDTGFANVSVGDEVEVVMGEGGACTAHVTSISYANPTYTVNLSETITGISGTETSLVRVHNWKFLISFNDRTTGYRSFTVPSRASAWIQVAVELRGQNDSPVLEEIDIIPIKNQ